MKPVRIVICGFGQIGRMLYRHLQNLPDCKVVALVDQAPLAPADLPPVPLFRSAAELTVAADIAVVTTVSSADLAADTIVEFLNAKLPVVTTCEELFHPFVRHAKAARKIDRAGKTNRLGAVATGINPGFLMDLLPATLSGAASEISKVEIRRIQDAAPRRMQFQKKIGAGLDLAEFRKREAAGVLRHVGLPESIDFLAAAFGWKLAEVTESLEPVIAETDLAIPGAIPVDKGQARGVRQVGRGLLADGREVIRLEFVAAIGEKRPHDRIIIHGNPKIDSTIRGGLNGDRGTCAMVVSTVRRLLRSERTGMLTMLDLPTATGAIAK